MTGESSVLGETIVSVLQQWYCDQVACVWEHAEQVMAEWQDGRMAHVSDE